MGPGDAPVAGGRRRTDVPQDGLWGAGGPPIDPARPPARGSSRPGAAPVGADEPVRIPRSRLPLPPVPAGAGALHAPGAVFAGMPAPELPGGPAGNGHRPERLPGDPAGVRAVLPRAARVLPQQEHDLVSTGPGRRAADRGAGAAARLPLPTPAAGAPSPAYGDWTKPSRSGAPVDADLLAEPWAHGAPARPVVPATTAIPERSVTSGRRPADDGVLPRQRDGRPGSGEFPVHGASGPTTGSGRAAMRAQRQAIDMARRKAAKRAGEPVGVPDDETPTRRPRRALMGLVAMVVVTLAVLGVYTLVDPTEASESTATAPTATTAPTRTAVLPPLDTGELEVEVETPAVAPATPVTAPVTVLNATDINGLAADVAGVIAAGGWQTPGVGTYLADDVATSTVFYTAGDQTQQQAAESLKAQFPQLLTTAERFFEVPADVAAPGLVVVLTAPW